MLKRLLSNVLFFTGLSFSLAYAQPVMPPAQDHNQPLALQASVIVKNVQAAGYPLVTKIELQDGMYKVNALDLQGKSIDIVVDPQKGTLIQPKEPNKIHVTLLDAISLVQNKNYHGIYKVEADDGIYYVYALDSQGNKVTLKVDANTGEVSKSWF